LGKKNLEKRRGTFQGLKKGGRGEEILEQLSGKGKIVTVQRKRKWQGASEKQEKKKNLKQVTGKHRSRSEKGRGVEGQKIKDAGVGADGIIGKRKSERGGTRFGDPSRESGGGKKKLKNNQGRTRSAFGGKCAVRFQKT